jgi:hypothetical protein
MLKGKKGDGDFTEKSNQFFLDVGWIRLTKMLAFKEMLNDFKSTDLDPRELILLYKNLLVYNMEVLLKHFNKKEFGFDLQTIVNQYKMENDKMDLNTDLKIIESKKIVAQILEHKNQKFTAELKKNPNKIVKFQYSNFSPFSNFIKKEQKENGVLLKDVVSFIQTNLIKLYVEKGDRKAIYTFFSSSHNKKQVYIEYKEIEEYLSRIPD